MQLIAIVSTAIFASLATAAPAQKRQDTATWEGPYTLTAHLAGHPIDGKEIQAAGFSLTIGNDAPAAYCPDFVTSCPNATDTVFAGASMWVNVPGGQQAYTKTTGAPSYSQAHSTYQPDYLTSFGGPSVDGYFTGPGGVGLAACPSSANGIYQVFFEVEGFNRTGCHCFSATAEHWDGGFGAWQYT